MSQATQQALPTGVWSADKIHSTVGFAVPYMAGSFQGTFSDFDARLSDGALVGTAEVASVEVKDPNLAPISRARTSSTPSASPSSASRPTTSAAPATTSPSPAS